MGIQNHGNLVHWNYFIALEQDLSKVSRFIEFNEDNFSAYSIELAHLLLASSSEVDVVLKALCNLKNPQKAHNNINDYKETVKEYVPDIVEEICYVPRFGLELKPWINWSTDENPLWWRSHTNVKHQRDKYFSDANLKHTLNSLAALHIVVLFYYQARIENEGAEHSFKDVNKRFNPESSLMKFRDDYYYDTIVF